LLFLRPRQALALAVPAAAGLIVIVLSSLGLPAEPHYAVPVAPAFVLLAAGALFGPRFAATSQEIHHQLRRRLTPVLRFAGIALAVIAAAWAGEIYGTKIHGAFHSHQAPPDLGVFLAAAGKVIHGASPYAFSGDRTYAYPPLVALLIAPLHPFSVGVATLLWTFVGLAAVCGALWLLGVRDARCYALALVYPVTKSAVGLGTIGPLLLLAVAVAWHWRDRIGGTVAVGAAVALKLFLWPLVPWLALTRRVRAALMAVAFALGLALIPWAAIGLDGLRGYPGLLRHLSRDEATSSYSVVALAVRVHLPESLGYVVSLFVAVALLYAAWRVARDERLSGRDRDVATLTLALAAGLAASPIVWVHYFLLLLVPLALARPRLSALWFVPFAYYPLGEHAWPAGNAWKLGLALVTTLLILAVPLAGYLRAPLQRSNLFGRRGLTAGSPREQH
jgi:glycosyl transferase family 87